MPRKLRNAVRQRPKSAITGSRIIPIVNSPNFRPSISTINAPSLLTAPFPLISTRDDKSNRRRRRPHLLASNIHVPSPHQTQIISRPRQPRLIFNRPTRTSPHVEGIEDNGLDVLAVDVLAAEAMKRYMPRHGIERSRHHRQRRNGNATGFRDPHVDKTFAYFESVSYEEGEEIVRFKQPGITAVTKLSSDERSCRICYYDYGTRSEAGFAEFPLPLSHCGHVFGNRCIETWIQLSDTCPYCRERVYL